MITHDIQRFSNHLAAIYANLAKPILDVILYNFQLSQNVGAEGVMGLTILVQLSAALCECSSSSSNRNLILFPSTIYDATLWYVHRALRPNGRFVAAYAFSTGRVCRRNRFHEGRRDGEDAH